MSTNRLKKHLQSLTKEQIVEVVLDAYNNSKAVQEYFDFNESPHIYLKRLSLQKK